MIPDQKIHPRSLLTNADQIALYLADRGVTATEWQVFMAERRDGRCICDPRWVTHHWRGESKRPSHRLVHDYGCPRRKAWMQREQLCNP